MKPTQESDFYTRTRRDGKIARRVVSPGPMPHPGPPRGPPCMPGPPMPGKNKTKRERYQNKQEAERARGLAAVKLRQSALFDVGWVKSYNLLFDSQFSPLHNASLLAPAVTSTVGAKESLGPGPEPQAMQEGTVAQCSAGDSRGRCLGKLAGNRPPCDAPPQKTKNAPLSALFTPRTRRYPTTPQQTNGCMVQLRYAAETKINYRLCTRACTGLSPTQAAAEPLSIFKKRELG